MPLDMHTLINQHSLIDLLYPLPEQPAPDQSDRLLVIQCSDTKRPGGGKMPAIDRYNGPLWQVLRKADPDGSRCQVAFLSAYYGGPWCARDTRIATYDRKLDATQAAAWVKGGVHQWHSYAHRTTDDIKRRDGGAGLFDMAHRAAPARRFREVCLVGGHLYIDVMRAELQRHPQAFAPDATWTEINDKIGMMLKRTRAWIVGDLA